MNAFAHLYVAAHIEELLDQAAAERLAATRRPNQPKTRIGDTAKSVWSFLTGGADRPAVPTLTDYPFRG